MSFIIETKTTNPSGMSMTGTPPESEIGFTNYYGYIINSNYLKERHCQEEQVYVFAKLIE
jgi:hypothetical protein